MDSIKQKIGFKKVKTCSKCEYCKQIFTHSFVRADYYCKKNDFDIWVPSEYFCDLHEDIIYISKPI